MFENSIVERFKFFKEKIEKSNKEIGDDINLGHNTVQRYLTLTNDPPLSFLLKLKDQYNLNLSWVLLDEGPMFISDPDIKRKFVYDLFERIKKTQSIFDSDIIASLDISEEEYKYWIKNHVIRDWHKMFSVFGPMNWNYLLFGHGPAMQSQLFVEDNLDPIDRQDENKKSDAIAEAHFLSDNFSIGEIGLAKNIINYMKAEYGQFVHEPDVVYGEKKVKEAETFIKFQKLKPEYKKTVTALIDTYSKAIDSPE